jgi:hypothetical protein
MIDEFDKDGDGEINENEFLGIMKQTSIYWEFIIVLTLSDSVNDLFALHICVCVSATLYQYFFHFTFPSSQ